MCALKRFFCLYLTNLGRGLWCVCLCAGLTFTPAITNGVWAVFICALILTLLRHSWLALLLCVLARELCLYPAEPAWCPWCPCLCTGFARSPPLLGELWCWCWCAGVAFTPPSPAKVCGMCLYSASGFIPPILGGPYADCDCVPGFAFPTPFGACFRCLCVCVLDLPLLCQLWLQPSVCVVVLGSCLHAAHRGWGNWCFRSCAGLAFTALILALVCGVCFGADFASTLPIRARVGDVCVCARAH